MKKDLARSIVTTLFVAAVLILFSTPAPGQVQATGGGVAMTSLEHLKSKSSGPAPRTADGKPDLSGLWGPDPHFMGDFSAALKPGEVLPLQPWALKLTKERLPKDDPNANCLPAGVPRMAPYPWKIIADLHGRARPSQGPGPHLVRRLHGQVGRKHAGGGHGGIQRQVLV